MTCKGCIRNIGVVDCNSADPSSCTATVLEMTNLLPKKSATFVVTVRNKKLESIGHFVPTVRITGPNGTMTCLY